MFNHTGRMKIIAFLSTIKDGKILKRFEPQTRPGAPEVIEPIETALAAK